MSPDTHTPIKALFFAKIIVMIIEVIIFRRSVGVPERMNKLLIDEKC